MARAVGARSKLYLAKEPREGRRPAKGLKEAPLGHTYTNILIHALFSTKNRQPWLDVEVRDELFRYLGGTVNELGGQSLLVNGPLDHVHMLLVQPATLSLADLMEKVKANSSGWIKKRWSKCGYFSWQTGYTAFSVSKSHVEQVKRYIRNQEEHHRKISFQEELLAFLKKNGIEYDSRYIFA
jgi:REP element-mobilizing transposase RayT